MLGFSPLASAALGDDGVVTSVVIQLQPVVTGNPVVGSTSITQGHNFTLTVITSGQPLVPTVGISQVQNLSPANVTSGQPLVPTVGISLVQNLSPANVTSGQPLVPTITLVENEVSTADTILTGVPEVVTTSIHQIHSFATSNILTGIPDVESAEDPNVIYEEVMQEMFGGWGRRAYEVPDGKLVQAEREVQRTYGDVVSIDKKSKSLIKFGKSGDLTANNNLETIWTVGGNETYVTGNTIDYISSSSSSDTEEITIESHTVTGTGVDSAFTFVTQNVVLNGQTPVALSTPVARVSRIYNNGSSELVGRVVVYEDTSVSNGIPSDVTKIHIDIPVGFQQSFKSATTFSSSDYFILTGAYGSVSKKQSASVDFYLEERQAGKVFRQLGSFTASSDGGAFDIQFDPSIIIKKNSDVRFRADTSTNNSVVFAIFKGYLASVNT